MGRFCLILLLVNFSYAQTTEISGTILDNSSNNPLADVFVSVENSNHFTTTNTEGIFRISHKNIPEGPQFLIVSKDGFLSQRIPVIIYDSEKNELAPVFLIEDFSDSPEVGIIFLSDDQLDEEEGVVYSISGFLQGTDDVFLQAAAYDFSRAFFSPRGFDSSNGKLLINGIEMNKFHNGRPLWANWGGLSGALRNRSFAVNTTANDYVFGDLAGTANITMRASQYRKGGRISYSAGNRNYRGYATAFYNSGLQKNGWAYSVLMGRRFAEEGYIDGTLYDANSIFLSFEKKINSDHSLNFTGFYTPNRRGKSAAQTQEVYDLKGKKYNSFWGFQEGELRNSRIQKVSEPVFMLNHFWSISENTELNTNIGYQTGFRSDSRLGYDNVPSPDPAYYQNLPSYFLSFSDVENAEKAKSDFINGGQIDWISLYETNIFYGGTARYYLYENRVVDNQWTISSILNSKLKEGINLSGSVNYRKLNSHNYAKMLDLLGAKEYLDIDVFKTGNASQSDLNHPNRNVRADDTFKYNYEFDVSSSEGFLQTDFSFTKFDFYIGGKIGQTNYQRDGLYRNGSYPEGTDSYGKSEKLNFTTYGGKAGFLYKVSGKHGVELNAAYFTEAPSLQNSFSNSRQNNATVLGLTEVKKSIFDFSYLFRSQFIKARLSGYYSRIDDLTGISFFYADGIAVDDRNFKSAFIQEILTDIAIENLGMEFGMETQISSEIKVKTVAALGQHIYAKNPNLYITSDVFKNPQFYGETHLKNYKIPGGPQRAFHLGVDYRNPKSWWLNLSGNYFSNSYLNVSPLTRTKNFYLDSDGIPFENYDETTARKLLKQEKFDAYFVVNAAGGKSWRHKRYYFGLSGVVGNILNQDHKTGGYEQGRNSNYNSLLADVNNGNRIFGPKYWYGYGTTYNLTFYISF